MRVTAQRVSIVLNIRALISDLSLHASEIVLCMHDVCTSQKRFDHFKALIRMAQFIQ